MASKGKSKNASPTLAGKIATRAADRKKVAKLIEDAAKHDSGGNAQVAEAGQEVAGQKQRSITV